jgi:precorrin-6B methylase 2
MRIWSTAAGVIALALTGCGEGESSAPASANPATTAESHEPDIHFVPTPTPVADQLLAMADLSEVDVLYDLSSGDGRIPIAAARDYGVRGVGIDIDPVRISEARRNAREAGVYHLVTFHQADLFETDISEASVVTLYLLSTLNLKLRPKLLEELDPGSRMVSHAFGMSGWEPDEVRKVNDRTIYMWTVPETFVPGLS